MRKLLEAFYGLKQGSKAWNKNLSRLLMALGVQESRADPSFYVQTRGNETTYVPGYVGDNLVAANFLPTSELFRWDLGTSLTSVILEK